MNETQKEAVDKTIANWRRVIELIEQARAEVHRCHLCIAWPGPNACNVCPARVLVPYFICDGEGVEDGGMPDNESRYQSICNLGSDIKGVLDRIATYIDESIQELAATKLAATKEEPDEVIRNISDG